MNLPPLWGNCWRCGAPAPPARCGACDAILTADPFLGLRGGPVRLHRHLISYPDMALYRAHGEQRLVRMVRVLPQYLHQDRAAAQRFILLGRRCKGLRRPNLLEVFQVEAAPDSHAWLMGEWAEGQSADTLWPQAGPRMPLERALRLAIQMLSALEGLHGQGLLHGRVGLHAFLLTQSQGADAGQDWLRLLDLGLGRAEPDAALTDHSPPDAWRGPRPWERWWSPDALSGQPISIANDVYAVAACLYALLTGQLPYRTATAPALDAARHGAELERVALVERRPELKRHGPLCDTVDRAISALRSDRFANASALREALEINAEQVSRPRRVQFVKANPPPPERAAPAPERAAPAPKPAAPAPKPAAPAPKPPKQPAPERANAAPRPPERAAPAPKPPKQPSPRKPSPRKPAPSRVAQRVVNAAEPADLMGRCARLLMDLGQLAQAQRRASPTPDSAPRLRAILAQQAPHLPSEDSWNEDSWSIPARPSYEPDLDLSHTDTFPAELDPQDEWSLHDVLSSEPDAHLEQLAWLALSVASPLLRQRADAEDPELIGLRRALAPLMTLNPDTREAHHNTRRGLLTLFIPCGDSPGLMIGKLMLSLLEMGRRGAAPAFALALRWGARRGELPELDAQDLLEEAEEVAYRAYNGELLAPREVVELTHAQDVFSPVKGSRAERVPEQTMAWLFADK
jgi:serine/threonine protein kinase